MGFYIHLYMKSKVLGKRIKRREKKPDVVEARKVQKDSKHATEMKKMKEQKEQKQKKHEKDMKEMKLEQEKKQEKHRKEIKEMLKKKENKQKKEETRDAKSLSLVKGKEPVGTKNRFETIMENNLRWATNSVKENP